MWMCTCPVNLAEAETVTPVRDIAVTVIETFVSPLLELSTVDIVTEGIDP